MIIPYLKDFDLIVVNSSGGKDSQAALHQVVVMASKQGFDLSKIVVSHQDLGRMEWPGTKELVQKQADLYGVKVYYSHRKTKEGEADTILEYARRRKKWPSNKQRWCTSDFKRAPGARVVTALTKDMKPCRILYVFGFRAQESPSRSKKEVMKINEQLTTKTREVWDWLPIHDWTTTQVWDLIKGSNLPYHPAYDLGMPRLSCCFCIFSPFDALVVAGKANPELLDEYVAVEEEIGHDFRQNMPISSVRIAIDDGYEPKSVQDWVM